MLAAMPAMTVTAVTSRNGSGPALSLVAPDVPELPNLPSGTLTQEEDQRRQELCEAALGYARHGWRVMPVRWITPEGICSCHRGEECPSPGKHPVHDDWPNVATSEPADVATWWRPEPQGIAREWFPYANIGIVTGRKSGIFVLDVDPRNGGEETLGGHERRNGELPETRIHQTGSGGVHYFFAHPGFDVRNDSKGKVLGKGLDIKGERGFVVAPPSLSAKGLYELNPAHDIDPAEAPAWLLDMLRREDDIQNGVMVAGDAPDAGLPYVRRYAESALRAEADEVRNAAQGERNDTLNRAAFALGSLGGAGLISEDDAWQALHDAALACGLGDGEARSTFLSGWRKGVQNPRQIDWKTVGGGGEYPPRPWTEIGNVFRMIDHWADSFRWCPERSSWMTYKSGVWRSCPPEVANDRALSMLASLEATEAAAYSADREAGKDGEQEPSPREKFLHWAKSQATRRAIESAASLARGRPAMQISAETFDSDPMLLNCRNGAVDLRTGKLIEHDPEQRMTMQCQAAYDPEARAPRWEKFLERVQPDPEMGAYLRRVMGYTSTGLTGEQVFFLHYGEGANGKGVFQEVISHVLGQYSQAVPVETLLAKRAEGGIPNDVARMVGRRYLAASETKAGNSLDEQRLKQLSGGDTISARFMRSEFFDFRPVGKIHLATNHLPHVSDDFATWRRIHLIRWGEVIPEAERDDSLTDTLIREEAQGILAWVVRGAVEWRSTGLRVPASAQAARDEYRRDEDTVGAFIRDCLEEVPVARGAPERSASSIFAAYQAWALKQGIRHPMSQRALTEAVKKHKDSRGNSFEYINANGWRGFPGLALRMGGGV